MISVDVGEGDAHEYASAGAGKHMLTNSTHARARACMAPALISGG